MDSPSCAPEEPTGMWLLCSGPLGMLGAGERQSKGRKPPSSHLLTSQSETVVSTHVMKLCTGTRALPQ